ncbi:MAG: DUF3095 domain-containing protein [Coleofasciculaceae cyanobacterium]
MDTELFYADLPVLDNFLDITESTNFYLAPSDWYVVITDIIGSTKAIESGRYKDVNLIGASSIIAVLNIAGKLEIPFIFGGDGASLLIPPSLYGKTRAALLATRQHAREKFGMDLRVGAVPVADLIAANYEVKVAKLKVSEHYYQAAFTGGGLSYATELIKNRETAELYSYGNMIDGAKADFSGLECRWQEIPNKRGEMVSLIVTATASNDQANNEIYREVIKKIQLTYGRDDYLNPITKENLRLAFSYKYLKSETFLRSKSSKNFHKVLYFCQIWLENIIGLCLMNFKVKLKDDDWGAYKDIAIAATDYKKFDDVLRMIIDGNIRQRERLKLFLEKQYRAGKLVYGLHTSQQALMTCLVFERHGRQVHFVDGAEGGYATAAKGMKQRIKRMQLNC